MKQHVLIVSSPELLESVAPIVEEAAGAELQHIHNTQHALALLQALTPELLVLVHPLPDSETLAFWAELESTLDGSQRPMTLALCTEARRPEVASLEDFGVTILSLDQTDEELARELTAFLRQAPRPAIRVMVKMAVELGAGSVLRFAQTVNASASGMFIRTKEDFPPESELDVQIELPGATDTVQARAVVVRRSSLATEGVRGVGVSFLSFRGADEERLSTFLTERIEHLSH